MTRKLSVFFTFHDENKERSRGQRPGAGARVRDEKKNRKKFFTEVNPLATSAISTAPAGLRGPDPVPPDGRRGDANRVRLPGVDRTRPLDGADLPPVRSVVARRRRRCNQEAPPAAATLRRRRRVYDARRPCV